MVRKMDSITIILISLTIILFIAFSATVIQCKKTNKQLSKTHILHKEISNLCYYKDEYFSLKDKVAKLNCELDDYQSETNDFSIERIVLLTKLIDSSEQEKNRFCKTKFDNNLCSLDGIFYLNYFCKNGKLFKWKIDIQYWDLFNVDCIKKDEIPKDINGKDILISTNIADVN